MTEKRLLVNWQDTNTQDWFPIGQLSKTNDHYEFFYTNGALQAQKENAFSALPSFPQLEKIYFSQELFDTFSNRLIPTSRPEYKKLISWLNLTQVEEDPITILGLSGGKKESDSLELLLFPEPDENGNITILFFVNDPTNIETLLLRESKELQIEIENNQKTLSLTTFPEKIKVGHIPAYLANEILPLLKQESADLPVARVEKINLSPAPKYFRLLCSLTLSVFDNPNLFSNYLYQPINDNKPKLTESSNLETAFDPYNMDFRPKEWFSTTASYEGEGYAEFSNPPGKAKGFFEISFDEIGNSICKMTKIRLENNEFAALGIFGAEIFFLGEKMVAEGKVYSVIAGKPFNPCTKIVINTKEGHFLVEKHIFYNPSFHFGHKEKVELNFHFFQSRFEANIQKKSKYWVLPLHNFVSDFYTYFEELNFHPLRLHQNPTIPSNLSEEQKQVAKHNINVSNGLITFDFNESPGFIEPLTDYKERKARLEARKDSILLTAVMVGEIGKNEIDFDNLKQWFPFDFLMLLSFATGIEVGAPWIEFRDEDGNLICRLHMKLEDPTFSKGHRVITELLHSGVGYLLTIAQKSQHYSKPYLPVLLKNLIYGSLNTFCLEDRFNYLCRAVEVLCEELSLYTTAKIQTKELDNALNKVLDNCIDGIKQIAPKMENNYLESDTKLLYKIIDKLLKSKNITLDFGDAILSLMKHFALPDEQIIKNYHKDNQKWEELLLKYQKRITRFGYFDTLNTDYDSNDLYTFTQHLHDILVRIVFRMLGYEGTYQPILIKMRADVPFDWVRLTTPISQLGY